MFNLSFHERSKEAVKTRLQREADKSDDDALTGEVQQAVDLILDNMPEPPEGGSILVSVRANIPLGGYVENRMVEIAYHEKDLSDPATVLLV